MLNQGNFFRILFLSVLCACNNDYKQSVIEKAKTQIGIEEYLDIYKKANDSINIWTANKLGYYKYCGKSKNCFLDSLICFNSDKTRFIGCILKQQLLKTGTADDIDYFYGEKINNNWIFFSGPNIFVPREIIEGQPLDKPLSYQQLHQVALKEVYSGYLNINGEINENWFTNQFEGAGWVNWDDTEEKIKSYTRKDYEQLHLKKVRNNWKGINKDSIKQLQ